MNWKPFFCRYHDWRVSVVQQHFGFALDERRIKWDDDVWLKFEADNAYMLEHYAEDDEQLLALPDIDEPETTEAIPSEAPEPDKTEKQEE